MALHIDGNAVYRDLRQLGKRSGHGQPPPESLNLRAPGELYDIQIDVVTDPTLSKNLPINNIKVSSRSVSFDWKDPDGDDDHWRLELTGKNDGQIVWVDLPRDVKVQPIPVSKKIPTS